MQAGPSIKMFVNDEIGIRKAIVLVKVPMLSLK